MKQLILFLFIVSALLMAPGCYKKNEILPEKKPVRSDVFNIEIEGNTSIDADGASTLTVKITILKMDDPEKRTITLETSAGTWEANNGKSIAIIVNNEGYGETYLKSTLEPESKVIIRGTIDDLIQELQAAFKRAYPTSIEVNPGAFSIIASADYSTTVTAHLKRETGVPSLGTEVTFTATDNSGNPIGKFRSQTTSNTNGIVTALFSPLNTQYKGIVTITAMVTLEDGSLVTGSNTIIVTL